MIPLRIDIWHNLERIFYAGIADANEDEERLMPFKLPFCILSNSRSICFSGYTSREKELYAQILDIIPAFGPIIEACAGRTSDSDDVSSQPFNTFIKLVRIPSFQ